jgi:hypothetical protein
MAFAPPVPLAGVISCNPTTFCGFYALAVDDAGRRRGFAALGQTRDPGQLAVDLLQQAVIAPRAETAAHCGNRRETVGQHAPLATGRRDVQDRVEHTAQIGPPGATDTPDRRHQRLHKRPFRVGQITYVPAALSGMLASGEFGPSQRDLRSASQPNRLTTC